MASNTVKQASLTVSGNGTVKKPKSTIHWIGSPPLVLKGVLSFKHKIQKKNKKKPIPQKTKKPNKQTNKTIPKKKTIWKFDWEKNHQLLYEMHIYLLDLSQCKKSTETLRFHW